MQISMSSYGFSIARSSKRVNQVLAINKSPFERDLTQVIGSNVLRLTSFKGAVQLLPEFIHVKFQRTRGDISMSRCSNARIFQAFKKIRVIWRK
ncbi:hypothetical protein CFP56_035543 [Quercus suber]|uniref:Uncharacterized protein n=1 Tax=Quercus suber TaxID=58331 RepID=A0AAW0LRJ3_QUESU